MYCEKCGHKLDDRIGSFCGSCGERLNIVQDPAKQVITTVTPSVAPNINSDIPPNINYDVNSGINSYINSDSNKVKKKGSKKKIIIMFVATLLLISAAFAAVKIFVLDKDKQANADSLAIKTKDGYNVEGNTAENLSNGGLLSYQGDWTFYANPDLNGALCAIKGEEAPIKLTDFPVANINVTENSIVFTDIYGSYYIQKDATGKESYSLPSGAETLTNLLMGGQKRETVFGGNLYVMSGIKEFCNSGNRGSIKVKKIDTGNSPAYSVYVNGNDVQYVCFSANKKTAYDTSTSTHPSLPVQKLSSNYQSNTKYAVRPVSIFGNDDLEKYEDGADYTDQNYDGLSTRDRNDRVLYWYTQISNKVKSSVSRTSKKWCEKFGIFQDETVIRQAGGNMIIGHGIMDPKEDSDYHVEKPREIKDSKGWTFLGIHGLPEINGITYVQVYKNKVTSSSVELDAVEIWAVDKKTGNKLNTYQAGKNVEMVVRGEYVYFKGADGFLYQTKNAEKPKTISTVAVKDFEFLYNGDVLCSYDKGNGATSQAILSTKSYEKEVYSKSNDVGPNDGVTQSGESGWYTHTDRSKFDKVLPIKTYRGFYQGCRDHSKMEIFKNKDGKYRWFRIEDDFSYTEVANMALPPEVKESNDRQQYTKDLIDKNTNSGMGDSTTKQDKTKAPDTNTKAQSSTGKSSSQQGTSTFPEAGVWVREDGKYTLTLSEKNPSDLNLTKENSPKVWYDLKLEGEGKSAEGYGFIPNILKIEFKDGRVGNGDLQHYGSDCLKLRLSVPGFDGKYYRK